MPVRHFLSATVRRLPPSAAVRRPRRIVRPLVVSHCSRHNRQIPISGNSPRRPPPSVAVSTQYPPSGPRFGLQKLTVRQFREGVWTPDPARVGGTKYELARPPWPPHGPLGCLPRPAQASRRGLARLVGITRRRSARGPAAAPWWVALPVPLPTAPHAVRHAVSASPRPHPPESRRTGRNGWKSDPQKCPRID